LLEKKFQDSQAPSPRVSRDGAVVRVWLAGRSDSLSILREVTGRLSDPFAGVPDGELKRLMAREAAASSADCAVRLMRLRQLKNKQKGDPLGEKMGRQVEARLARHEFEVKPLKVASPPRAVGHRR